MAVHLLLQDGEHVACGRLGQASTFISMVDCSECRGWYESNEWAKRHTPQFNETLGSPQLMLDETELPECNFCHAIKNLKQVGDALLCPAHAPGYEAELDGRMDKAREIADSMRPLDDYEEELCDDEVQR